MRRAVIFGLAALALWIPSGAAAEPAVAERLIVTFEPGARASERAAAHRRAGGSVEDRIPAIDAEVVRVGAGNGDAALRRYRGEAAVRVAERDVLRVPLSDDCPGNAATCVVPSDPGFRRGWGLQNDAFTIQPDSAFDHDADIDAPFAWQITTGSTATRVAILDSGIDQDHEDLAAKIVAQRNFSASKTLDDRYGHGTHVAGTAAAITNNGRGVAGVGFDASLMNVKVLSDNGFGSCSAIANGIAWAADNGANAINLSLGGGACSAEESAVNYAWGKGALIAAAAGNSGAQTVSCPACYANTIAVAATDNGDVKADFSNYGPGVDLAAPGVDVWSTFPNHRNRIGKRNYDYGSGTSMATPHVAGAAALIWSITSDAGGDGKRNDDVRSRIETYADDIPGTGSLWSAGRLNACRAAAADANACPHH